MTHKVDKKEVPYRIFYQAHIIHKDSEGLKVDLKAPINEQYKSKQGKVRCQFPKGVYIIFYEKNNITPCHLKANWAQELEGEGFYKAKGKVEIVNSQGDTIRTEEIFWNRKEKKIYTNTLTEVHRSEGTELIAKNGFENSENLILKNTKGIILLKGDCSL